MQSAKNMMVKKVVTISKNRPVTEAASTIAKHSISCIVVTAGKKPIGILTERDIVRDVLVAGVNSKKVTVNDVMNKDVPTVTAGTSIIELVRFMKHKFLRRVPVVNNRGELIGIITETDVVNAVIKLGGDLSKKIKQGSNIKRYVQQQKDLYNRLRDIREIRNKISTGSKDLNNLLGGGLPIGSSTLICGEPGSGKTLLAYSFLHDGLLMNNCGIYIFSNELLDEVRGGFKSLGFNIDKYEKRGQIFFDDICSADPKKKGPDICSGFKDLHLIKEFIENIRSKKKGHIRLVINIVSQAYRFWTPDVVYRFVFELKHYVMENNITALFIVDKGVESDKEITSLEELMDGVILLKTKEEGVIIKHYLLIKKIETGELIPQKYYLFQPIKGKGYILRGISKISS